MAVALLAAAVPGAGFLWAGRRLLGLVTLLAGALVVGFAVWRLRGVDRLIEFAVDPDRLRTMAVLAGAAYLLWAATVVTTYLMVRPRDLRRGARVGGGVVIAFVCLTMAAPVSVAARYATVQADLVTTVFQDNETATIPSDVTVEDPWGGRRRVNVLLLGGDGGVGRTGIRTDSVILLSMDTRTGDSVMFSLPRNMMNARFPAGSPLHRLYPDGFRGVGDASSWMLNAVYGQVPALHPGLLGRSDNEGADAVKQAVSGSLGVRVDYYALVNLRGFREVVDAIGGVTVNINQPIPIGGIQDLGVPPEDYLQPGPHQRLDGFSALWFARGRYGLDDYNRMLRQRCLVQALIDEANPFTLLRRYQRLAAASKQIVRTDVPAKLLPAFVALTRKVKDAQVRSIAFVSSADFVPSDPDFDWLQAQVEKALRATPAKAASGGLRRHPPTPSPTSPTLPGPGAEPSTGPAAPVSDSCQYQPVS